MPNPLPPQLSGLTTAEVAASQKQYGYNQLTVDQRNSWFSLLLAIFKEPMLILLLAITSIYLVIGQFGEALFMLLAILAVSAISFYQDNRSKKALEALEKLNEPLSRVIRNGQLVAIPTHEIAVGDLCVTEEGDRINADGIIVHSTDFSVNESALTGESLAVYKSADSADHRIYSGTQTVSGRAVFQVEQIGAATRLGQIGTSLTHIQEERSPLQQQMHRFVRGMAIVGTLIFLMVWLFNYWKTGDLFQSLLVGLTLAMSVLPEEIPVAFTTFMALGAWKLMREGIIIKRSAIVETLGSTTVICTDKTGTITENSMQVKQLYDFQTATTYNETEFAHPALHELIAYAMWSSEPIPFDPMEKSLHAVYGHTQSNDLRGDFQLLHEYPLEGQPPMMTHIFENASKARIIAAKGAPEALLQVADLTEAQREIIRQRIREFGAEGYRVLGVGKAVYQGDAFLEKQQSYPFEFLGLVVFYDPPKKGIQQVFEQIEQAGIQVKVITGDHTDTTRAIAAQAGISNPTAAVTGADILAMKPSELTQVARQTTLFTRMFPDAKLKIIETLKNDGQVVAMLGDGVNDAPALKSAHIGVAMGEKGTEIAKAAASLVIVNDDLEKLLTGIAAGRRIYTNIKKAVQYIISIHIPIILTVSLPLFLGWEFPHIFTPVHVIFLEIIMGPTCSIVYENEPLERNAMRQKPRKMTETFLNRKELSLSIVQGLLITLGVLGAYQYTVRSGGDEASTRAMVFTTLLYSNIFLCLANRSFVYSIWDTMRNKNRLFPLIIGATLIMHWLILKVPLFADFFQVNDLRLVEMGIAIGIAAVSVGWFELYKGYKRKKARNL